ncbi:hypothetical protein F8568_044335 [Actinomadura sp. LD22]|uniref:Uncharacterized protein n=1 Tax=Actinomadura physcomitrii TaxID=2650748 RepID=A0A6I4MXY3_9ACTN|nr:hypothetical protein [Actinomadura physcomitrii]MWA07246.1 hypothetical protein [Actinomadura physcomitrii]
MPRRDWPSRIDELSGVVVVGIAIAGGALIVLGLLFFAVVAVAGIVHGLLPYWRYVLAAFGLLVVLPMTVTGVGEFVRARKRRSNPPPSGRRRPLIGSSGSPSTGIPGLLAVVAAAVTTGRPTAAGQGPCLAEGPPYTTQTVIGLEGDVMEVDAGGTPCGCSGYVGIEPP